MLPAVVTTISMLPPSNVAVPLPPLGSHAESAAEKSPLMTTLSPYSVYCA